MTSVARYHVDNRPASLPRKLVRAQGERGEVINHAPIGYPILLGGTQQERSCRSKKHSKALHALVTVEE